MSSVTGASTSDSQISAPLSGKIELSSTGQKLFELIAIAKAKDSGILARNSKRNLKEGKIYMFCTCTECGEGFPDKANLKSHEKTIHGSREFRCNSCSIGFKTFVILDKHIDSEHANQQKLYCQVCKMSFTGVCDFNLDSHMREHEPSNGMATTSQDSSNKPPIKLTISKSSGNLSVTSSSGTNSHSSASASNGGASNSAHDLQPSTSSVNSSNHSAISHTNGVSTDSVPSNSSPSLQTSIESQPEISNGQKSFGKRPLELNKKPLNHGKAPEASVNGHGSVDVTEMAIPNTDSPPLPLKKCKRNITDGKRSFYSCHKCSSLFFNEEKLNEHMIFHNNHDKNPTKRQKTATTVTGQQIVQNAGISNEEQSTQPSTSTMKVNNTNNPSQAVSLSITSEPNSVLNNTTHPQPSGASVIREDAISQLPAAPVLEFQDDKQPKDPSTSITSHAPCRKKGIQPFKWICPKCNVNCNTAYSFCYHIFTAHIRKSLKMDKDCDNCDKMLDEAAIFFTSLKDHLMLHPPDQFEKSVPSASASISKSSNLSSSVTQSCSPTYAPSTSKAGGKQPLVLDKSDPNGSKEVNNQAEHSDLICIDSGDDDEDDDDVIFDEMNAELWKKKSGRIASFFSCKVCRHTTQCPKQIEAHMLTHADNPNATYRAMFKCEFCNMCFARRCTLLLHRLKHLKQQAMHCEFCGRPFATAKSLAKHHNAHVKHAIKGQTVARTEHSQSEDSSHEFGPGASAAASASSSSSPAPTIPVGKQPTHFVASSLSIPTQTQTPIQTRANPALSSTILMASPNAASTPIVINTKSTQASGANPSRPSVSPVKSGHPTNRHHLHNGQVRHQTPSSQQSQAVSSQGQMLAQGLQQQQQISQLKPSPQRSPIPIQQQVPPSFSTPQSRLINSNVPIQPRPPVSNPIFVAPISSVGHPMPQQQQPSPAIARMNLAANQLHQSVPISTMAHTSIPMQQQTPQLYRDASARQQGIQNAPSHVQYLQRVPSPANQGQSTMTQQQVHMNVVQRSVQHTTPSGQSIQHQILLNGPVQMVSQPSNTQFGPIQQSQPQIFVQQPPQNMMQQQMNFQVNPRMQVVRNAQLNLQQQASQHQLNQRVNVNSNPQQQQSSTMAQNPQQFQQTNLNRPTNAQNMGNYRQLPQQGAINSRPVVSSVPVVPTNQQPLFQQSQQQQQRLHIQVSQGQHAIRQNPSPIQQQQNRQNPMSAPQQQGQQPIRQNPSPIQQQNQQQIRQNPMSIPQQGQQSMQQQQNQQPIRQNPMPAPQQQGQPIRQNPSSIQQQQGQPIRQHPMPPIQQQQQGQQPIRHNFTPSQLQNGQQHRPALGPNIRPGAHHSPSVRPIGHHGHQKHVHHAKHNPNAPHRPNTSLNNSSNGSHSNPIKIKQEITE